jgi:hypothetical protein
MVSLQIQNKQPLRQYWRLWQKNSGQQFSTTISAMWFRAVHDIYQTNEWLHRVYLRDTPRVKPATKVYDLAPHDIMPESARHFSRDTFRGSAHAEDRSATRNFHVAFYSTRKHLDAVTTYFYYIVTESLGLLHPSGTPNPGFVTLHGLPAALTLEKVPVG